METPLLADQFHWILLHLDTLIRIRGVHSLLLELESLLGHLPIYETLNLTSSSGLCGLVADDYPAPPQSGGDAPASVDDELPLLSLLEKVGGFALLWACHYRGITAPYTALLLPESSTSRDSSTILCHIKRMRPSTTFAAPLGGKHAQRFRSCYNNQKSGPDFSMVKGSKPEENAFASLDEAFIMSMTLIGERGRVNVRKLWTVKVLKFKDTVTKNPAGKHEHPGSYFMFLFERALVCLRSLTAWRRQNRLAHNREAIRFHSDVLFRIEDLGYSRTQLVGIDLSSRLSAIILRSSNPADAVAAFATECRQQLIEPQTLQPPPPWRW